MKCKNRLSFIIVLLLALALIAEPLPCLFVFAAEPSDEEITEQEIRENRPIDIHYYCYDKYGDVDKHFTASRVRDGQSAFLNAAIDARKPELVISGCGSSEPQFECLDPEIAYVTRSSKAYTRWDITLVNAGNAGFRITIPASDGYRTCTYLFTLRVIKHLQRIVMKGYVDGYLSDGGVQLDPGEYCHTDPIYESEDESIATVDETGYVTFLSAGSTRINVTAPETQIYQEDTHTVYLTVFDRQSSVSLLSTSADTGSAGYWESDTSAPAKTQTSVPVKTKASAVPAAKKAGGKLSRPKLKFKRLKRGNKLTWSKVSGAAGYEVYVRYPGKKKFVKAVRKSAKIKSVTHRGLSKGRVYSYKVRAFRKKGKTRKYGPFSKVVKVRVK